MSLCFSIVPSLRPWFLDCSWLEWLAHRANIQMTTIFNFVSVVVITMTPWAFSLCNVGFFGSKITRYFFSSRLNIEGLCGNPAASLTVKSYFIAVKEEQLLARTVPI